MPNTTAKDFVGLEFNEALAAVRGGPPASAFYAGPPRPTELHAIYARGYQGVRTDRTLPEHKKQYAEMRSAMPGLYEVFPWAQDIGKGKLNVPYVAILKLDPEWGWDDPQERGDCTVHGTAHAGGVDYGIDALMDETKYKGRLACENIYRSRGFSGDGWSCEAPCTYVGPNGNGGFLYRQVWKDPAGSESVDLSHYNSSWEGNGRAGTPAWMETLSKQNKVKWVIPIPEPRVYRDAHAMGFGINVCSGQGFSSTCDENGLANAQGAWSHSMAHVGNDDRESAHTKYGDIIGLIDQNWGKWNNQDGSKKPDGCPRLPGGSFFGKMSVIAGRMLGDDSFALCGVWGWDRTNWEAFVGAAFNPTEYRAKIFEHFKDSTVEQYYKARQEKLVELTQRAIDEASFLAI